MSTEIGPLFEYLNPLNEAVEEIANTWRPDDPGYRADVYRQIMMQFSYGYFVFFHADPEHPDRAPLWNPVYTLQPNPDDIYVYYPIEVRRPAQSPARRYGGRDARAARRGTASTRAGLPAPPEVVTASCCSTVWGG
jgi:hypothetical protein